MSDSLWSCAFTSPCDLINHRCSCGLINILKYDKSFFFCWVRVLCSVARTEGELKQVDVYIYGMTNTYTTFSVVYVFIYEQTDVQTSLQPPYGLRCFHSCLSPLRLFNIISTESQTYLRRPSASRVHLVAVCPAASVCRQTQDLCSSACGRRQPAVRSSADWCSHLAGPRGWKQVDFYHLFRWFLLLVVK